MCQICAGATYSSLFVGIMCRFGVSVFGFVALSFYIFVRIVGTTCLHVVFIQKRIFRHNIAVYLSRFFYVAQKM